MPTENAVLLAAGWLAAAAAAGAAAGNGARANALRLRLRLTGLREDEMRATARVLIAAARISPHAVCERLDAALCAAAPELDAVLLYGRDGGIAEALVCVYASGRRGGAYLGSRVALADPDSPVASAATRGHRIASVPSATGQRPLIPGDRTFLAVPLVLEPERPIAVAYLASSSAAVGGAFASADSLVTLVDLAAGAYAAALERAADHKRAVIDELTGLLTPRAFRVRLGELCRRARGGIGEPRRLALLFIDTDHFKAVNDGLGHAAGDIVLRALARIFSDEVGTGAVIGRNGGDEFCIALLDVEKSDAVRRAERLRRAVERYAFGALLGREPRLPITMSIGVATFSDDGDSAETLLERADAAMYHSKRNGRNRVSFYSASGALLDLEEG